MILILGDTHIPFRAEDLPQWVKEIVERRWDIIIHTGDVNEGWVLEYLSHHGELVAVRGNTDFIRLPSHRVVHLPLGRALVIHGHQVHPRGNLRALAAIADKFSASLVIHGHTHIPSVEGCCGKIFINPGSATGVPGGMYRGEESLVIIKDGEVWMCRRGGCSRVL